MKKILFYTDTPNVGGAEKQMLFLAKYLRKQNVSVSLAYGQYSKMREMHDELEKVFKHIFVLNVFHKHDPRHFLEVKRILKEEKFDLIHIHLWNPGAGRYAFWAANGLKMPIVTTEHDPFELRGMKRAIKMKCLGMTTRTIAISRDNKKELIRMYGIKPEKISLVHNGIELERFLKNKERAALPVELDDIVVTCVAELHERKGHRHLIAAIKKLQKKIPNIHLMLVGRGPVEGKLKEQAKGNKNIHFLGWRNDVPQILRASDVFILPSFKEAFGLALVEAMASEVVVVASNSGGVVDIVENEKTGVLVEPGSSEALAEGIEQVLSNPKKRRAIEEAALKRSQYFTAERMAKETLKIYKTIFS